MAGICNLLCLITIAVAFNTVTADDYCNMASCNKKRANHTMCKYTSSTPAAACGQFNTIDLSDDEIKEILDIHNKYRQQVTSGDEKRGDPGPQPAAVSMPDLIWDSELKEIAQRWAIQCNFNHDQCRDVNRFAVGQNIGETYSSGTNSKNVTQIIESWYDEVEMFANNTVDEYKFDPKTGHYTQIVWAKTTKIGCGHMVYKKNGWNTYYLVCNYGPSGNWIGQKIYERKLIRPTDNG